MKRTAGFAATAILLVQLFVLGAHAALVSEIEEKIMCQCGCNMVLATCQCGRADQMRGEIQTKLDSGMSPEDIIQSYVAMYGETVLAAPTKRGFNLTAWVLPFVVVVSGLVLLFFISREFVRRGRRRSAQEAVANEELAQFRVKVNEELKDYL